MPKVHAGTRLVTSNVLGIKNLTLFETHNDLYLILNYSV
jgi:hypothetical protein